MKSCFIYPGQGAQYPGMGKDLWDYSREVRELFELAADMVKMDLKKLLFEGTEEELKATDRTQIAVTLVDLSSALVLRSRGVSPQAAAGFSLGEYAALCEAGVVNTGDIFPIVGARGRIMEETSRGLDSPGGNPGMSAIIGLPFEKVREVLAGIDDVYLANYNSPVQMVISGTGAGLEKAESLLKERGAKRAVRLHVSGPFHSPLLREAGQRLKDFLKDFSFNDPKIPVYSNVTGGRIGSGGEAKALCVRQVTETVRWVDIERALLDEGFSYLYETGPGKVLTGLWKAFNSEYGVCPAGTLDDINKIQQE